MTTHTTTSLKRWSRLTGDLPAVSDIKAIHVYDFDNTLFLSPLPNPKLWAPQTVGHLQGLDTFEYGGWWHDARILAATGEGIEIESKRKWAGWWNEQIVSLVQLSMQQKDALNVLLTGRSEKGFADLVKRIVASKDLKFDMICLKPEVGPNKQRFRSTLDFKHTLIDEIMHTYRFADEIRVYEDRIRHVDQFQDYFQSFNRSLSISSHASAGSTTRPPFTAEVIHVINPTRTLDPVTETALVQQMISLHNDSILHPTSPSTPRRTHIGLQKIHRSVLSTCYLLPPAATTTLLSILPPTIRDFTPLATHIPITPYPAPEPLLDKIGGLGRKVTWKITHLGTDDGKRIWAARVRPLIADPEVAVETWGDAIVALAVRGDRSEGRLAETIREWKPVDEERAVEFESRVANKEILRITFEGGDRRGSYKGKRKYDDESMGRRRSQAGPRGGGAGYHQSSQQHYHSGGRGGGPTGGRGGPGGYQGPQGGYGPGYGAQHPYPTQQGPGEYVQSSRGGGGGGGGGVGRGGVGGRGRGKGDARGGRGGRGRGNGG